MKRSSKTGEIALTLTLISLGIMLLGTMLGGIQQQQKTTSRAAGTCDYFANAIVKKRMPNGSLEFFTYKDNKNKPLNITNDFGQQSSLFKAPVTDTTKASFEFDAHGNFTYPPYKEGGDHASVTLQGLDTDTWKADIFCTANGYPPGKGCEDHPFGSNNNLKINNLHVICGVNMVYGWIVEPKTGTTSEPTPTSPAQPTATPTQNRVPTQAANSCIFNPTAYVKLQLADHTEIPLDVKVEQNVTAWKFTNSARVTSTFSTTGSRTYTSEDLRDKQYCCGTQNTPDGHKAKLTYLVGHEPLINSGDAAKVDISNYVPLPGKDATYEIVKKCGMDGFCTSSGRLDRIEGLRVACANPAYSYSYGWVFKCTGQDCYRPLVPSATPTPVSATFAPRPTVVTVPPITFGVTQTPTGIIRLPTRAPTYPTRIPTQITSPSVPTPSVPANPRGQYISAFCTEKDAYVLGLNALKNTNYGNAKRLFIGGRPGDTNQYIPYRSYIQFDLQNSEFLSRKPIIKKVELGLADTEDDPTTYTEKLRFPITAKKVLQSWSESSITWNTQPSVGSIVGTQKIANKDDITRFDLPAALVQEWVDDPSSNNGLLLIGTEDESVEDVPVRSFYASEEVNIPGQTRITCMRVEYDGGIKVSAGKIPLTRKDINHDHIINGIDFALMVAQIGKRGVNIAADLNNDGIVNALDVSAVIASIGQRTD